MERKYLVGIILGSIVFLYILAVIVGNVERKATEYVPVPTATSIPLPTEIGTYGTFSLRTLLGTTTFSQNHPIQVYVMGDSGDQAVVGYDIVMTYNQIATEESKIDFVSAKSLIPDFQVYTTKKNNTIFLTGVKNLQSKTRTVLKDSQVIVLTFLPKSEGRLEFSMLNDPKTKSVSRLMSDQNKDILRGIGDLTVDVIR